MVIHEPLVTTRKVTARFAWRHHFWGDYAATIIADCGNLADANACKAFLERLGATFEEIKIVDDEAVVAFYTPGPGEDSLADRLEAYRPEDERCSRCDRTHSIGDTAHSIDWAQPFTIEFDAPYLDHPGQRMLPGT